MRYILLALLVYFLVRFVIRFVIPVAKMTRMASNRMKEMQDQMNQMQQQANNPTQQKPRTVEGDYIEYEEIK